MVRRFISPLIASLVLTSACGDSEECEAACDKLEACHLLPSSLGTTKELCISRCEASDDVTRAAVVFCASTADGETEVACGDAGLVSAPACEELVRCAALKHVIPRVQLDVVFTLEIPKTDIERIEERRRCPGRSTSIFTTFDPCLQYGATSVELQVEGEWFPFTCDDIQPSVQTPTGLVPGVRQLAARFRGVDADLSPARCLEFQTRPFQVEAMGGVQEFAVPPRSHLENDPERLSELACTDVSPDGGVN